MSSRPPAKKRTPSILVTDVRTAPPSSRKAPFGNKKKTLTPAQINDISVDSILYGSTDIPSGRKRAVPKFIARQREQAVEPMGVSSAMFHGLPGHPAHNRPRAYGNGNTAMYHHGPPAQMTTNIPSRTTKMSQKLVLLPENEESLLYEDIDDAASDLQPPPTPWDEERHDEYLSPSDEPRRTFAERYPKDKRTDRFPRVTAYCISAGIRLQASSDFLRANHKVRPRIYDEAVFAPYFLPLLPGCGEGSRIKSSPGGVQMLEQLIDLSEQGDHHFEYFSGLERSEEVRSERAGRGEFSTGGMNGTVRGGNDENEDFDPSEPQDFSPRVNSYMPHEEAVAEVVARHHREHSTDRASKKESGARASNEEVVDWAENQKVDSSTSPKSLAVSGSSIYQQDENVDVSPPPMSSPSHFVSTDSQVHSPTHELTRPRESPVPDALNHAELFIFSYGVVVFWNFTEQQEKAVLADLTFGGHAGKSIVLRPISDNDIETEEMHFTYSPNTMKPRIYNDMITLRSGDHMIKLAMSHALAQSTKLSRFEARMDGNMHDVKHVPRTLALSGKLGMKREDVLKISGELFRLRVDVNLSSNVLDTPEFFWESEPSLNPLYTAIREYLEIDQRVLVLNERCKVFLELTDIIADSIAESNMSRITWIIIILIALSLSVSTVEIFIRFTLLKNV